MKTKKKAKKRASTNCDAAKKLPVRIVVVAAALTLVIITVGVLVAIIVRDSKILAEDAKMVQEQQAICTAASAYVDDVLSGASGSARIYDRNGKSLFTVISANGISGANALPERLASAIQDKVLAGATLSRIDLDAWSAGHTTLGALFNRMSLEEMQAGSLGWQAAERYCSASDMALAESIKLILAASLDATYTREELLTFIACAENYGGYSGVSEAATSWFNLSLDKLKDYQLDYLAYAFNKDTPKFEQFVEENPDSTGGAETPEEFGFSQVGSDTYWLLKTKVCEELESILGSRLQDETFNVSLAIDTSIQGKIQQVIDEGLRSSIELGADGLTTVDGVAGVVDPKTGFVVALVGGRSINNVGREFELDCASLIGNYRAAADAFKSDPTLTYATLKPVETAAGTTEYVQFGALVAYDQLASIGISPVVESKSTLDELLGFGAELYLNVTPRYVSEIQDSEGNIIYTAATSSDVSAQFPNPDVRALLMNSTDSNVAEYSMACDTGVVQGVFSSEYILGVMCGTSTAGYQMTFEDTDACWTTAFTLGKLLEEYYPRDPQSIDPTGAVATKVKNTQVQNSQTVVEAVDAWVEELSSLTIKSVGTAAQFEQAYSNYIGQLSSYDGLIDSSLFSVLKEKLDNVRIARAEDLVKFAA